MKSILAHKVCSKCKEVKEVSQFVKDPQKKDGLYPSCKDCYKKFYVKTKDKYKTTRERYKAENRAAILTRKHERYNEIRDELLVKMKEYHDTHKESEKKYRQGKKEKIAKTSSEWAKNNKERTSARLRKWRAEHKDKVSVQKNNRRAREAGGRITNDEWMQVLEKFGNKCLCCGRSDTRITMDHVVPLAKGGLHVIDNVQPLCKSCNSRKQTKHIDYRYSVMET